MNLPKSADKLTQVNTSFSKVRQVSGQVSSWLISDDGYHGSSVQDN